jgi:DNA-binding XRE family transcriptional regulator
MKPKLLTTKEVFGEQTQRERIQIEACKKYYRTLMQFREKRKKLRFTQEQLAKLSGVSRDTIARIETGERNPTLDTLFCLGEILKLDLVTTEIKA